MRPVGIQESTWFTPFCLHPEITILGLRRKVYVSGRDLLGIRSWEDSIR